MSRDYKRLFIEEKGLDEEFKQFRVRMIKESNPEFEQIITGMKSFSDEFSKFIDNTLSIDPIKSNPNYQDVESIFNDLRTQKISIDIAEREVCELLGLVIDECSRDWQRILKEQREEFNI